MNAETKTKLATAREAKEKREEARDDAAGARELEALELEERFEKELGPRGSMFEIVETIDGPIVVKLGEAVLFKKFKASLGGDPSLEEMHQFVWPCVVHPTVDKFNERTSLRPGLLVMCTDALVGLFAGKERAVAKK